MKILHLVVFSIVNESDTIVINCPNCLSGTNVNKILMLVETVIDNVTVH